MEWLNLARFAHELFPDWLASQYRTPSVLVTFAGITEFSCLRAIGQGNYQFLRHSAHGLTGRVTDVDRIEHVGDSANPGSYVLAIHGRGTEVSFAETPEGDWFLDSYYLCVTCRTVQVESDDLSSLFRAHGEAAAKAWQDFRDSFERLELDDALVTSWAGSRRCPHTAASV